MGNAHSCSTNKRSASKQADRSERSDPSSQYDRPDKKKSATQCSALISELLPSLINSEVLVDDLLDVAQTFEKLLKQIQHLQHNGSGQQDYSDDDDDKSIYYFTYYPDDRYPTHFYGDSMKESDYADDDDRYALYSCFKRSTSQHFDDEYSMKESDYAGDDDESRDYSCRYHYPKSYDYYRQSSIDFDNLKQSDYGYSEGSDKSLFFMDPKKDHVKTMNSSTSIDDESNDEQHQDASNSDQSTSDSD